MSNKSEELESLHQLISNAENFGEFYGVDDLNSYQAARNFLNSLLYKYSSLEEVTALLEQTKQEKFSDIIQRDDEDQEKITLLESFDKVLRMLKESNYYLMKYGYYFKEKLGEDFEDSLGKFLKTFWYTEATDEECIALISDNPNIQKMQLQIALAVSDHKGTRIDTPYNQRLVLQKALIDRIDDKSFLSSLLRDFIVRPCDQGQIPCPHAHETVKQLIDAGADPNVDYIDINYDSPGLTFLNQYSGLSAFEMLIPFTNPGFKHVNLALAMMNALGEQSEEKPTHTPEILFYMLMHAIIDKEFFLKMSAIISEIADLEITAEELPQIIKNVEVMYTPILEKLNNDDPKKQTLIERFRRAEALMLEGIYLNERRDEHRYLHRMKVSLYFAPLILPLIITAIFGLIYLYKKSNTVHTVQKEDLAITEFKKSYEEETDTEDKEFVKKLSSTYAMKFPIKEKGAEVKLRKAIVFNEKTSGAQYIHNPYYQLTSIFNGTSKIPEDQEGKLKNDVRIYSVRTPNPDA